jgi:hypothetical protein
MIRTKLKQLQLTSCLGLIHLGRSWYILTKICRKEKQSEYYNMYIQFQLAILRMILKYSC